MTVATLPIIILCQIFDLPPGSGKPFLIAGLFPPNKHLAASADKFGQCADKCNHEDFPFL